MYIYILFLCVILYFQLHYKQVSTLCKTELIYFLFQSSTTKPFPRIQVDFALSNREDDNLLKTSSPIQFTLLSAAEEIR